MLAASPDMMKTAAVQQPDEGQLLYDAFHNAVTSLLYDASHDKLTHLPNRTLFISHLELAIEMAARHAENRFAVIYLDIDRFKVINDALGHTIGDKLLVMIARRLEACLPRGAVMARLGGDEFAILFHLSHADRATHLADTVLKEITLPYHVESHQVFSSASLGVVLSTTGYDRPENILRDAETAMRTAKALGRSRYELFDNAMHARAMELFHLETDLRRAVERGEFRVYYQPIESVGTGMLAGFEALVRWQHPERGLLLPAEFIARAEEMGLIIDIDRWVLRESCRQMRSWQTSLPAGATLTISVNFSGKQFMRPDTVDYVREVLRETGLDARSLEIEITESVALTDIETAVSVLARLRALGVQLTTDDFGTGYSSLSYLHQLPISKLKIDRFFISRMEESEDNREIVRTIVALARTLGMDVVAEGVETEAQSARLRTLDCHFKQGFLFSEPIDADGAGKLILSGKQACGARP
jgi:diguanylate cyclase (GGDEF)-like protein